MSDVLSKWADPQLWFVFGLPALLLVGLVVLLSSGIGMVVWALWSFLEPRLSRAFDMHTEFMRTAMETDRSRTQSIAQISTVISDLKPELAAHTAAMSHGARALAVIPFADESKKNEIDHHIRGMEDALRPHTIRCQS